MARGDFRLKRPDLLLFIKGNMTYSKDYIRRVFEGEAPCDKCHMTVDCKEYEWACRAFSGYVLRGFFDKDTARIPTRELFSKVFNDDETALKQYLKAKNEHTNQDY